MYDIHTVEDILDFVARVEEDLQGIKNQILLKISSATGRISHVVSQNFKVYLQRYNKHFLGLLNWDCIYASRDAEITFETVLSSLSLSLANVLNWGSSYCDVSELAWDTLGDYTPEVYSELLSGELVVIMMPSIKLKVVVISCCYQLLIILMLLLLNLQLI
eukprot:GHVR01156492.1.p1 GENE.GHVR01156492.1~~GHVR01156492.1.p1  ORF type:complete len:161 (-),score=20.68 GHVR01156492.1:170-652(-)